MQIGTNFSHRALYPNAQQNNTRLQEATQLYAWGLYEYALPHFYVLSRIAPVEPQAFLYLGLLSLQGHTVPGDTYSAVDYLEHASKLNVTEADDWLRKIVERQNEFDYLQVLQQAKDSVESDDYVTEDIAAALKELISPDKDLNDPSLKEFIRLFKYVNYYETHIATSHEAKSGALLDVLKHSASPLTSKPSDHEVSLALDKIGRMFYEGGDVKKNAELGMRYLGAAYTLSPASKATSVSPVDPAALKVASEASPPKVSIDEKLAEAAVHIRNQEYLIASGILLTLASKDPPSPEAMVGLGDMHCDGLGTPVDVDEAKFWYDKAANLDYADGYERLGSLLVQISLSKSWSECAIEKISALMCHEETSLDRAWQHFEKAAELGSNRAHFYMGHMYQNGLGRNKDDAKAMEHYKIIAARGFPSSFTRLAFMYLTGAGVKPNVVIAWRCLIKAAALGDAVAAFELGESFDSTCSTKPLVKKDDALAIYWYAKSVAMIGGNVNGYLEQAKQSEQRIHLLKQKTPSLNNPLAEELFQKAYDVVLHDQIQQAEKLNPLVKVLELPDSGFVLKASSPHWPCNDEQDPHSISEAQRELGRMYSIGQYVQKNVEEAQRYIGFALSRWLPKT